jgi:hypothetical protein
MLLDIALAVGLLFLGTVLGHVMSYLTIKEMGKKCQIDTRRCLHCDDRVHCPMMRGRIESNE